MRIAFDLTWLLALKALAVAVLVVGPWAFGWLCIVLWALGGASARRARRGL